MLAFILLLAAAAPAPPDLRIVHTDTGPRVGDEHGPLLRGAVLYDFLGERDLAETFRSRELWQQRLGLIGSQLIGTGMLLGLVGAAGYLCADVRATCSPAFDVSMWSGLLLLGAGTATMVVGIHIDPEPTSAGERDALIERYNARLARPPPLTLNLRLTY